MSWLKFDGSHHRLTLYSSKGQKVGQWHANNVVAHSATLRFVPNGMYHLLDHRHPHRHHDGSDTINNAFGRFGIIRLQNFAVNGKIHTGVGVHAGRKNQGAYNHATYGCIRTTDEAMAAITKYMKSDPLKFIHVMRNHVQHNTHPQRVGDSHI